MPAVRTMEELDRDVPNRLSTCPAEERVEMWYDVPDAYAPGTKQVSEGETLEDSGVVRQKCGGGHRVLRKRIGGN